MSRSSITAIILSVSFLLFAPVAGGETTGTRPTNYIVVLSDIGTPESVNILASQQATEFGLELKHVYRALGGYSFQLPPGASAPVALASDPAVAFVAPDNGPPVSAFPHEGPPLASQAEAPTAARFQPLGPDTTCVSAPVNITPPSITGTAQPGNTLTGSVGTWETDGTNCITQYRVYWDKYYVSGASVGPARTTTLAPPSSTDTYYLEPGSAGYKFRLRVTAVCVCGSTTAQSAFTSNVYCASGGTQTVPTGIDRTQADLSSQVSGNCAGSTGGIVAVLDTGVYLHPDLNITSTDRQSCIGSTFDDDNGHGTEVAGLIGARDNSFGIVGTAPSVKLISIKLADAAGQIPNDDAIICALDRASYTRVDGISGNDVTVANISAGRGNPLYTTDDGQCGASNGDAVHVMVCRAVKPSPAGRGMALVAASGNDGSNFGAAYYQSGCSCTSIVRPAAFDEVLAVTGMADYNGVGGTALGSSPCGNTEQDDQYLAGVGASNYASSAADQAHTIAGPGACLYTTNNSGAYVTVTKGTSFSAPLVTGIVAICFATGSCTSSNWLATVRSRAQTYSTNHPEYRFTGDPFSSNGHYYGYLVEGDTQ